MKLGPSLDEPLLALWKGASDEGNRQDGENGYVLAVVRVEVRNVVTPKRLREHPNDDAVEAGEFRHVSVL